MIITANFLLGIPANTGAIVGGGDDGGYADEARRRWLEWAARRKRRARGVTEPDHSVPNVVSREIPTEPTPPKGRRRRKPDITIDTSAVENALLAANLAAIRTQTPQLPVVTEEAARAAVRAIALARQAEEDDIEILLMLG